MSLVCVVTGTPHPNITWYKDDKLILMTGKQTKCENGVCTLTIFSTVPEDAGTYTCEAENLNGVATSTSVVEIKRKYSSIYPFKQCHSSFSTNRQRG